MGISHNSQSTDHLPYKAGTIPNSVSGSKDNAHSPSPTFLTRPSTFHIRQVVCIWEMWEMWDGSRNSHLLSIPTVGNRFGPISQPVMGWDGFRSGNCGLGVTL